MTQDLPKVQYLTRPDGMKIAYHHTNGKQTEVQKDTRPGILFLGGFMSDMTGTKATHLETHCLGQGLAYTRFDYTGHGQSSGKFVDGTIGRWAEDAIAILDEITEGPQILVGSSMGGWIMLLVALARPERIAGIVGLAAAPDFTEDLMWGGMTDSQKSEITENGMLSLPTEYGDDPYIISHGLIEDGRNHLLLRNPIDLTCPIRLIQGMCDDDVPWKTALRLTETLRSTDIHLELIKNGDHRLSNPDQLDVITHHLDDLIRAVSN